MNIAILGASFDPSHNGHLQIAKNVLKSQKIHKIILMPTHIHPFGKKLTPAFDRLKMAKFLEDTNIEISNYEINKRSTSYSIETLKFLQKKFPQDHLYWIIGADNLISFEKWKNWQNIIKDFGLIIVPRDAIPPRRSPFGHLQGELQTLKNIIILNAKDFPPLDISSSEIRTRIRQKKSITNLVPNEVKNYIIQNKLYT